MDDSSVLRFWFEELTPRQWFEKSDAFDREVETRFLKTLESVASGECHLWRRTPGGRLAEVLVLDQFSRNVFRNQPRAFAQDPLALVLAQEAIGLGAHQELDKGQRVFLYMPFMHSESRVIHAWAMELFSEPGMENYLEYEVKHKAIIDRFGRYPHRNAVLGRESTPEEEAFLKEPGSSF